MKIQIISDLHADGYQYNVFPSIKKEKVDLLICAGDISCNGFFGDVVLTLLKELSWHFKDTQIIFVPGNHDFYGLGIEEGLDEFRNLNLENVKVLYNEDFTFNSQRFIGSTLWIPLLPNYGNVSRYYSDFHYIKNFERKVEYQHNVAKEFINKNATKDDIVITHFVPTPKSVALKYAKDPLTQFFMCNIEDVITNTQPKLWIHGHTHDEFDYIIGNTRILCTPYGYSNEQLYGKKLYTVAEI
jgi:Icc-related predicted phosphoesterase